MKWKRLLALGLLIMQPLIACSAEDNTEVLMKPDCVNSFHSNGSYRLTIIANQTEIRDKQMFAEKIIEQVRNNDFKTIRFSYDLGGDPTSLDMTVYLDEDEWKEGTPAMSITLRQDNWKGIYNIVDDLDKFQMKIE